MFQNSTASHITTVRYITRFVHGFVKSGYKTPKKDEFQRSFEAKREEIRSCEPEFFTNRLKGLWSVRKCRVFEDILSLKGHFY